MTESTNSPITGQSSKPGKIQVLTLTPFFPAGSDDASGCFVSEPLSVLAKKDIRSMVLAVQPFYRSNPPASNSDQNARWLRYFSLPGGIGLPSAGAFLFARIVGVVRELQKAGQVDLIHAHGALPCGHAAMLLAAELQLPYVVSAHGLDVFSTQQVKGRAGGWCRRISDRVYRSSRRVICVSERVREQVLEGAKSGCRTSVVYNGVDQELFSPPTESSTNLLILTVGNLIPIKGHDVLIRAVASIHSEFPELVLDIIGDGPERSRLERLTRELQIQESVRFLGRQSRAQVAAAMKKCTLFALASRYEGLGCVYLEAMSAGKPVIGCRDQGIAEIIQHGINGFLVGPGNEKELALALGMLLRSEMLRRNLGTVARDTILDNLTLEHQAEKLSRIYRESI